MTPQDLVALGRRHFRAMAAVLVVSAGLALYLHHLTPTYTDSATVIFNAPDRPHLGLTLFTIDALTADSVMSAQGQDEVRNGGGTASFDVALVNLNDEDYPNYGVPYVSVSTSSTDPAAAQRTFSVVMRVLQRTVTQIQARQGAPPDTWITVATISAPTGPIAQTGSRKRSLAALLVLTIIAAFMIAQFLDRHPIRLRDLLQRRGIPNLPRPTGVRFRPRAD